MKRLLLMAAGLSLSCTTLVMAAGSEGISGFEFGFNRIVHGWTNYSTGFSATHDASSAGEFATVASFFAPAVAVQPQRYGVIVVWYGSGGQRLNFADFTYKIFFWSSLEAFVANPRQGDLATYSFAAPTGGSTTVPDATTLGGRAAYHLQFDWPTNLPPLVLTQCQVYLVGFAAQAMTGQSGELLVPTAPSPGASDVQAGNIVPFGWNYLVDAGGLTIYSGRLATQLAVLPLEDSPALSIRQQSSSIVLEWPEAFRCYTLEESENIGGAPEWKTVENVPILEGSWNRVTLPGTEPARWFRLRWDDEKVP